MSALRERWLAAHDGRGDFRLMAWTGGTWLAAYASLALLDPPPSDDQPREMPATHPPVPSGVPPCGAAVADGVGWPWAHVLVKLIGCVLLALLVTGASEDTPLLHHPMIVDAAVACMRAREWAARRRGRRDATQRGRCLLYTSPSPRDRQKSRMPSSA